MRGHGGPESTAQRLTDAAIKRLPVPGNGNKITYDDDVAGFGIRVTAAGARSFVFNYRTRSGRERRHTIGSHPDWRTTGAREEARRLRRLVDEGGVRSPISKPGGMRQRWRSYATASSWSIYRVSGPDGGGLSIICATMSGPILDSTPRLPTLIFPTLTRCTEKSAKLATSTAPTASWPRLAKCSSSHPVEAAVGQPMQGH